MNENSTATKNDTPPDQLMETVKTQEQENTETDKEDPYAYLDRGEFSSENFKIEVKNLPRFYGISEFKKLLNGKLKLNINKIKTPKRNSPYAFICFRSIEDRDNGIKVLSGFTWKGNQLQATYAKASADPLVKKRKEDSEDGGRNKKRKIVEFLTQAERIKMSTIPLADMEYAEQLKLKQENMKTVLRQLAGDLSYHNIMLKKWIETQKEKYDGLPCELLDIRYADHVDGYRTKCEFTVGMDYETNLPTVGFRIGAYVHGVTGVAPVDHLKHIPDNMKVAVKAFQDFVCSSELQVFNPELQTGNFRQLCARTASDQLMLIVGIHPQNLAKEKIEELKKSLIEFFFEGGGKHVNVTSLYYQEIVKKFRGESSTPAEHLCGETHLYETILGIKFRISPEAFFQTNAEGAKILYESVIELAEPKEKSTMIDVCCGTGTIGLCFSKKCDQILGLEVIPQAIVDAKENAIINNITNSEFFTGRAEDILGSVCFNSKNEDVFAVVDPPRAGLHQRAIHQLRKIPKINRLVYVACNPNMALKNFVDLGRPQSKSLHGEFLVPVKAVAIDLFPHTKHCELVVCFKRWDLVEKEMTLATE